MAFGGEEDATRGLHSMLAVVEARRIADIAPGPCRGWGRNSLAHIRAQKEPVVSPVGAGTDYRRPRRVSWPLACTSRRQAARRPVEGSGTTIDQECHSEVDEEQEPSRPAGTRTARDAHAR